MNIHEKTSGFRFVARVRGISRASFAKKQGRTKFHGGELRGRYVKL
jgi:hypothetical protein